MKRVVKTTKIIVSMKWHTFVTLSRKLAICFHMLLFSLYIYRLGVNIRIQGVPLQLTHYISTRREMLAKLFGFFH